MIKLLELPTEVLTMIFGPLVTCAGVKTVVKFRVTCKTFDSEIQRAIWTTRALESDETLTRCGEHILTEYLLARTRADRNIQRYPLTTTILETIAYLQQIGAIGQHAAVDYVREACLAVVRWHRKPRRLRSGYILEINHVLSARQQQEQLKQSSNAFAFATHLGLTSLVDQLVHEGVTEIETAFGIPILCAAIHQDPRVMAAYLNAKRSIEECARFITDFRPQENHGKITEFFYGRAIYQAICFGAPETVENLISAAMNDNEPCFQGFYTTARPKPSEALTPTIRRYTTVLFTAVCKDRLEIARLALDRGADPDCFTHRLCGSLTALEYAAKFGLTSMFELLIERGADIRLLHRGPKILLDCAVKGGSFKIVKTCLDAGIQPSSRIGSYLSYHPLVVAARNNRSDLLQLLGAYGVTFKPNSDLERELLQVASKSSNEIVSIVNAMQKSQQNIQTR